MDGVSRQTHLLLVSHGLAKYAWHISPISRELPARAGIHKGTSSKELCGWQDIMLPYHGTPVNTSNPSHEGLFDFLGTVLVRVAVGFY